MKRWLVGFVMTAVIASGCGKTDKGSGEAGEEAAASGSASPKKKKGGAKGAPTLASNATVLEHLKKIGDGCTVKTDSAAVYGCKAHEDADLVEWVAKEKPKDVFDTFAGAIAGKDDKARAAAIALSNRVFSRIDHDLRKANATAGAATVFLDALAKDDASAPALAATATHIANLAGESERLLDVVGALKNKNARNESYRTMMTYGRLDVFPAIKEAAKQADHAVAALSAPREMYDWKPDEAAQVCPWAKGYLGDERIPVAAAAAQDMVRCKGEYIDALLDEGEKRLAAKAFKAPLSDAYREVCFEMMKNVTGQAGKSAQCTRTFAFLEKVANDASVESSVRGLALWNIYYQKRDQETLDLMRRYENHSDPEVSKRAKEAINSLTTVYKLK